MLLQNCIKFLVKNVEKFSSAVETLYFRIYISLID